MQAADRALKRRLLELRSCHAEASQQKAAIEASISSLMAKHKGVELELETERKKLLDTKIAKHRPDLQLQAKLKARIKQVRGCAACNGRRLGAADTQEIVRIFPGLAQIHSAVLFFMNGHTAYAER